MPSFAKKRVAPVEQEMVSLIHSNGGATRRTNSNSTTTTTQRRRGGRFSSLRRLIPTQIIPSVGSPKFSGIKKRFTANGGEDELRVSLIDGHGKPTAAPEQRKGKQSQTMWTDRRLKEYGGLFLTAFFFVFILMHNGSKTVDWSKHKRMLAPRGKSRCYADRNRPKGWKCNCPDPQVPLEQTGILKEQFKRHHKHLVQTAKNAPKDLDIVFLGDSIVERWSGTAGMGVQVLPGPKVTFEQRFTKVQGGKFEGRAFGTAGDIGPNLLWHIKNGLIDNLNPKIWFIMIGTNDLFVDKCSEKNVIANIMNVVKEINEQRPDALFVIHGIMPRLDNPKAKTRLLGKTWKKAQHINSQIRKFCKKYKNMYYIQGGETLMVKSTNRGRGKLDPNMVDDGVHPTVKGYEVWGDFIETRLDKVYKLYEQNLKKKH